MKLSSWPNEITEGVARASGSPFKEFCANVTIQTQWKQNLIIASTADEDYALKLGSINGIELGATTYEMTPYIKALLGTVRGVVHGITACTTEKRLAALLAANTVASCMRGCSENPPQQLSPSKNPQADHGSQLQCKAMRTTSRDGKHEVRENAQAKTPNSVREGEKQIKRPTDIYNKGDKFKLSEYGRNKPQQEQQKISWAEVIASSKSTTDPFPSLPTQERNSRYEETISSLRRQNTDLMKRNEGLMKRLEEQDRRQEEQDRRAQAREQALETKLQDLFDQLNKQQEPTTKPTPPREHTPPIEDLGSGIKYKMNKARTEEKAELRNEFRAELAQAVDTIRKSVAATVQAAVRKVRQEITQMGNEISQRISILKKDKQQARKKPKYPIREAQLNETLGSQDSE
ncbi:hypothetical protein HPB49_022642 [Dermacentor silvarum]|uniref:Uncharacterized protein n=1 Tax=Dermacentor silvarum TaxID=543639 RepID=A0ACB8CN64_DERSI|nr:hypothetical protein HPB49_022642 [Dermacentor silvarum]